MFSVSQLILLVAAVLMISQGLTGIYHDLGRWGVCVYVFMCSELGGDFEDVVRL